MTLDLWMSSSKNQNNFHIYILLQILYSMENSSSQEIPREKIPSVFMYQPTKFEVVTGDKLKEWETNLRERVGMRGINFQLPEGGSCTACRCPDADDCDQD